MKTDDILKKYPIISDQVDEKELRVLLYELERKLRSGETGNAVEFGCYAGTTSLFIRRLLDVYGFRGEYHVYDSFSGLPEKSEKDRSVAGDQFKAGELSVSRKNFIQNFKKAHLVPPIIHKSWFSEISDSDVPDNIFFAFFDGDFYESIRDSFHICSKKFSNNCVIVVDDYINEALPGAAKATDEWIGAQKKPITKRAEASLAIIQL